MNYTRKTPFIKSTLALAVAGAVLTGCGGGGGDTAASGLTGGSETARVSLSGLVTGRVADGYIMGATAFLDIDGDKQLDSWEPSHKTEVLDTAVEANKEKLGKFEVNLATWLAGLSDTDYAVMLQHLKDAGIDIAGELNAADLMAAFSVVVDIPAEAIDADKPTETIGSAIKLAAPPKPKTSGSTETDAETFISPITTVLDQKVTAKKKELKEKEALGLEVSEEEKDVSKLVTAAKQEVKTDLGLTDADSDELLTGDYVSAKSDTDTTKSDLAKKLHTVAKVTTTLLAKGVADTTGGSTSAAQLDEATRQAIIDAVTEKVLAQLKTIAAVSDKIVAADTSGTGDVSSIDINQISEKAQEVVAEGTSDDSDAASLTDVTVDQDEIEAAKAATEEAQQEEPAEEPADTVLTAFLNDAPKQIVLGTAENTLTYRDFALAQASATWGGDFGSVDNTAAIWDTERQQWVDVTVSAVLSGTEQTLTFTPAISTAETSVSEREETVPAPAAITADTPLTLTRTLSGTVTDLAGKSIRAQVSAPNWKNKITIGSTFTNGEAKPQRARLVAQSNSSVTVKLAENLSYNGLNVQIAADATVSFTDSANNTVTSFITDTVIASDGAFTVPADIAARFNIPVDRRDWVDVASVLGYQLGKNPVIFDWFNDTAFDQIATQALSTDGLVSSPNLVASLSGDTVTVNAASLLIPEGYTLNSAEAVIPALYGKGDVLAVTGNTFTLDIQIKTARVTLRYTSTAEDAEDIIQTGYIHRGKNTAGDLVAGRDYKVRSKIQWDPVANEGTGAYEHALEVLLRESRFADLKAATLDGQPVIGPSETPVDYQVEGIYRVYGPKTVAADAAPVFDLDGAGATDTANISLPTVPTTKPAVLSSVAAGNIAFDGQKLTFTSLKAADAPNATDICFELSLAAGTDTVKKLDCAGKPSDTGSYTIDTASLGVNLRAFDDISITGLTLDELIDSVEVSQSQTLSNASVLEKGSLAQKALMGENFYLTTHNEADSSYTYLTVSYNPDTGLWNIIRKSSDGSDNTDAPVTSAVVSGGKLIFTLGGVESTLELNAVTTEDLTDVNWLSGGTTSSLTLQTDEAAFITWKSEYAEKVLYSSLFRSTPFAAGENMDCSGSSGHLIESGFDLNGNKLLDSTEVSNTWPVCDGSASINVVRLDGSTSQCADVGGTRLDIGIESILLCNSDGSPRNYPQAKSLALGFGTWVNALESHAVKVSDSVETQTAELDALVSNDGIDTSMMGLQFAIHALDAAHRQFVHTGSTTEQTYEVATLIPELDRPSDLVSLAGTVTVSVDANGQPRTLTLTGFSADIDTDLLDETNLPVTTMVTMDPMSVPALTAASSFSWTMANVVAKANDGTQDIGQVTAPSVQATLTTTNDIALVGPTADAGLSSVSLNLGSETDPVRIETLNSGADIASERVFTGSLTLDADLQQDGYLPSRKIAPQTINLSFNGQLEYNGQTLDINLGLNAPQIYQMDLSGFDIALDELNTGEVLTGWKSVTAVNGLDEYFYNAPSSSPQSLTRYSFTDRSGNSRSYALALTGTGRYQVWRVQNTDWGQVRYDRYDYQTFSNLAGAQKAVLYSGLTGHSYYSSNSETQIWAYQEVYSASNQRDSLEIGGYYDLSVVSLPEVGAAATSYDLNVDYVDYDHVSRTRFDNHSLYTATAGFSLKNLKGFDAAGAPTVLPDVALTVEASRTGYSQGDAKFTLNFEGEELTARYHHWDLFAYGGNDGINGSLMDLSFTDDAGGLIVMDPTRVSCDWGEGWDGEPGYQAGDGLACALGASRFRLMVNGVDHGKVWQDMNGQWIAVLGDGDPNIDEKQQDEFVVYTPQ